MKKLLNVIIIITLFISAIYPLNAKALQAEIFASNVSMTETTENGQTFSLKNGNDNTILYIGANVTEGSLTELNAHVELENSSFTFSGERSDYKLQQGWSGTVTKSETGNGIDINLTNSTGIDSRKLILSITLDVKEGTPQTDTCLITLGKTEAPATPETPKCKVVDNTYYDANGNAVSKEAYDKSCSTPAENPQTGSFLPYTIIIALIVLAGWLYYVTKKNNKIYDI